MTFYGRQLKKWFDVVSRYFDRALAPSEGPSEGPLDRLRSPRFWAFAMTATALAVLILFWSPDYYVGVLAAVALPIMMAPYSAALVVFMALIAQEEIPGPGVGFATILGDRAYYTGRVPMVLIVAVTAALVAVVRLWRTAAHDISLSTKILFAIVGALVVLSIVDGFITGQSLLSAINQNARPFIACGVGIVIGLSLREVPKERRVAKVASAIVIVGLAVAAGLVIVEGMSADPRVSRYFTYSDSALPAVAAAVFLALLARKWRRDWRPMVVAAACLVIVVIGFRRGVWIGAAAALAIVLLVAPGRRLLLVRLAFATVGLMAMLLVLPGMAADVHDRLVGAPAHVVVEPSAVSKAGQGEPAQGDPTGGGGGVAAPPQQISDYSPRLSSEVATNSTEGHMSDLRVGWRYVEKNFWTGVGPRADQLPGLVANRSKLVYVHNEWLMDWLRFGPLAPVLVTAFLGILAIMAIRTLRRPESGSDQLSAAMFGLLAPVVLMLFPLMTTSTRWPLFLGISAGILGLRKSGAGNAVVGLHRLNRPAHEGHQQTAL